MMAMANRAEEAAVKREERLELDNLTRKNRRKQDYERKMNMKNTKRRKTVKQKRNQMRKYEEEFLIMLEEEGCY